MQEGTVQRKRVLIVDDEPTVRDSLQLLLKSSFDVSVAPDGVQALGILDEARPDLILLDVMMPKLDGIGVLRELREREVAVPVIMLTANNTVKSAVEAMKLGAIDYLSKPFDVESLTSLIVSTLGQAQESAPTRSARHNLSSPEGHFGSMVGVAPNMGRVFQQIEQVAVRDTTVLITGESGTGKELVARRVHELSARSDKPFVPVNCAAIPETLIESELFGHEKGSFTNAVDRRIGYFELADGGTLFLDEIGELSLAVQVKMLRFLQEHEFYRVGRSKPVRVNVRIIAATNRNLEDLIKEKRFRQDLFYRINVINVELPPLRDRYDDIPQLVGYFLEKYSPLYTGKKLLFSDEAIRRMVEYSWPGNVRELENVIESLLALSAQDTINVSDLPPKLQGREVGAIIGQTLTPGSLSFQDAERAFESEMIMKALRKTNFVQTRAAELLGISRRILKYKMDKLGISEDRTAHEPQEEPEAEPPLE